MKICYYDYFIWPQQIKIGVSQGFYSTLLKYYATICRTSGELSVNICT